MKARRGRQIDRLIPEAAQADGCAGEGHRWAVWKRDPAYDLTAHHQRWVRFCHTCATGEERWSVVRPEDLDPAIRGKVVTPSRNT